MSSYELLELFGARVVDDTGTMIRTIHVDFAPEDGALAKAMRGGEGTELVQAMRQSANEMAVLRAAFVPNADASQYGSRFFLPLSLRQGFEAEREELRAEQKRMRDEDPEDGGMSAMWTQKEVN